MTEKSLVKVTVEYDGDATEFENKAALVVVFDNSEEKMGVEIQFSGYTSFKNLAFAVASAIKDLDDQCEGFLNGVMDDLLLIKIHEIADSIMEEE